jgi:hypothetical protein
MATRGKAKDEHPLGEAERELRHDAEADREYTTPRRAREADAAQPPETPEGKDPPAHQGEDDRGRLRRRDEGTEGPSED